MKTGKRVGEGTGFCFSIFFLMFLMVTAPFCYLYYFFLCLSCKTMERKEEKTRKHWILFQFILSLFFIVSGSVVYVSLSTVMRTETHR